MKKCSWCGNKVSDDKTIQNTDTGKVQYICLDCHSEYIVNRTCRICKGPAIIQIDGCCSSCIQVEAFKKARDREEALHGVGEESIELANAGVMLSDAEYEDWLLLSNSVNFEHFKNDRLARQVWILVKLAAVGIRDPEVINKNMADAEALIEKYIYELHKRKCKLIITYNNDTRKLIKEVEDRNIIGNINDVFLLEQIN